MVRVFLPSIFLLFALLRTAAIRAILGLVLNIWKQKNLTDLKKMSGLNFQK
jgi:hypothetical protein